MRNNNKISTTLKIFGGRMFAVAVLFTIATVGTAFAGTITKSFEFGAGTTYSRSNVRTFNIPCGTVGGIAAVVKFQRLGPDGASNNIPIIIELREPDTAVGQEGPLVETKTANATKTQQTVILRSQSSNRGCSLPWRVRVKYANDGTAPVQAFGSIRVDFDGRLRDILVENINTVKKGESQTIKLGSSSGLEQGKIDIPGNWRHVFLGGEFPGPNPIKLKIQLTDPYGTVVKTAEGYADYQAHRDQGLPIFRLIYQVTTRVPGQWKLKITNLDSNDDAGYFFAHKQVKFTPGCP